MHGDNDDDMSIRKGNTFVRVQPVRYFYVAIFINLCKLSDTFSSLTTLHI